MEVIDTLPPRKRRKTEGDIPKSLFWFGQGTGVTKFGVGLLQPFPQATNPHVDSNSLNLPVIVLSPAKETMNQLISDERNERQYQQPQMTHTDPHSIARLASQQTNLAPIKTPRGSHHKVNLGAKESQIFDPAYNLLQPPRVHVRSSSGFPELNDIHVESISAAALFAKRRRVNSQPTLTSGTGESPQDYAPHQRAGGIWGPSQRPSEDHSSESSSERAPLLSRSRQLALDAAASRSRKHQSVSLSTDDGVNETLQHIGKCKSLWFVVIAILVGVFLILFLYAFHILD
ncbi:hypothetical protein TMatcc_000756 [Talaromyces marneffei ATCC 18224]|nr:hypothetical protein EYB25_008253 [Talaromyces marneffei]